MWVRAGEEGPKEEGESSLKTFHRGPTMRCWTLIAMGKHRDGCNQITASVLERTVSTACWRETGAAPWKAVWQLLKHTLTA